MAHGLILITIVSGCSSVHCSDIFVVMVYYVGGGGGGGGGGGATLNFIVFLCMQCACASPVHPYCVRAAVMNLQSAFRTQHYYTSRGLYDPVHSSHSM